MASHTMVVAPIISALVEAEKMLGKKRNWQTQSLQQVKFINDFFSKRNELSLFKPEELQSWVSDNADELNSILAKERIAFRFKEFRPDELGVVSILSVLIEWLAECSKAIIKLGDNTYPAILMKNEATTETQNLPMFETYVSSIHDHPVFCVNTKTGERVSMTVAEKEIASFSLVFVIEKIRKRRKRLGCYNNLIVPMIDYESMVDISWLQGLNTTDQKNLPWNISQAMQQTKFKMNCQGARVKSAVAIAVRMCASVMPNIYTIDKPFLLWIEREGLDIPIMYAYLDKDTWKNPWSLYI